MIKTNEKLVEFLVRDQKISGFLHDPITYNPPVVVMVHDFASDMDENGMFSKTAQRLSEAGFLVLRFDLRGHGKSFGSLDKVTVGSQMEDIQMALDKIGNLEVNKNKIGVLAMGFGAVPVILSGDQRIKAFVMWNPIVKPNEDMRKVFDKNCEKGWEKDLMNNKFVNYGSKRLTWDFWDQIRMMDMTKEIREIRAPTMIVYGSQDEVVSIKNTRNLFWASNEPREKFQVASRHGLKDAAGESINQTVKWFTKWLM